MSDTPPDKTQKNGPKTRSSPLISILLVIALAAGAFFVIQKVRGMRPVTLVVPRGAEVTVNDYTLNPKRQPQGLDLKTRNYLIRLPVGPNKVTVRTKDRGEKSYTIDVREEEESSLFVLIDNDFRDPSERQPVDTNQ